MRAQWQLERHGHTVEDHWFRPREETGVLMTASVWRWLSMPVALVIGSVGAASVFKAVYVDSRELKCACVGGGLPVPLIGTAMTTVLA